MEPHETLALSWNDCRQRAAQAANEIHHAFRTHYDNINVFAVPRGGVHAYGLVQAAMNQLDNPIQMHPVDHPSQAACAIDDLYDSGATAEWVQKQHGPNMLPMFYLCHKPDENLLGTWISFPWERAENESGPEDAVVRLLQYIGEDVNREGLKETPKRMVKALKEMTAGYTMRVGDQITVFEDGSCDEMVVSRDIEFFSMCEHHMLPFFGTATIGYIPNGKIIGLSKLTRILDVYARRLQVQERLTEQVTAALNAHLSPLGAACVIKASHMCMMCRGVRRTSEMVTSSMTGAFREKPEARAEFMALTR